MAENALPRVSAPISRAQVVSLPLPICRNGEVCRLILRQREAGAGDPADEPACAFGMQLNPALPASDADTVCRCAGGGRVAEA